MRGTYDEGLKFVEDGGLVENGDDHESYNGTDRGSEFGVAELAETDGNTRDASPHSSASDAWSDQSRGTRVASNTPPSSLGSEGHERSSHSSLRPLHILFLGSSLGNFDRKGSISFLRSLPLRPGSGDTLLLGLDHDNATEKIELAYNDLKGLTKDFIMNGLKVAGRTLGDENLFEGAKWEYVNLYNEEERKFFHARPRPPICNQSTVLLGRHEAYYKSVCDQKITIPGTRQSLTFIAEELVNIEVSYKVGLSLPFLLRLI